MSARSTRKLVLGIMLAVPFFAFIIYQCNSRGGGIPIVGRQQPGEGTCVSREPEKSGQGFQGDQWECYPDGRWRSVSFWKNGEKYGQFISWDSNGKKVTEGSYREDRQEGKWVQWFRNGQKRSVTDYISGRRNGEHIEWNERGQIRQKGTYRYDRENGEWYYYNRGRLAQRGSFVDGKKHGEWTFWTYRQGNKSLRARGRFHRDRACGIWKCVGRGAFFSAGGCCSYRPPSMFCRACPN